jgi:hypothetical protein
MQCRLELTTAIVIIIAATANLTFGIKKIFGIISYAILNKIKKE